jgi:hypothetical protein
MLVRSSRLPRNQSAGRFDERPLRTVHQRPPKKNTPSKTPALPAEHQNHSFIHRHPPVRPAWPCLPWPPNARHSNSRSRGRQPAAPASRNGFPDSAVQPETKRRAEQRRNRDRPADQPHHAQAEPDRACDIAPRLELARRLRTDLLTERRLRLRKGLFWDSSLM